MRKLLHWRLLCLYFVCLSSFPAFSQRLSIGGNVQDTTTHQPLRKAVVVVSRLMDSTLVSFTRTDDNGLFRFTELPIDTYQVVISHPLFNDQPFFVFGDAKNLNYDFGKIILPSKDHNLAEVLVFAYRDPIYYKGDTLIYTADSFKTRANATVEDLLKKLPGIKVDANGKITSQGKSVDQVLVDGDEFFGTDPTVATKNLNASAIESVQVYDKKKEDSNSDKGEETVKVMNLKLKEDAKKGYFGKVSGASDFQKFYEGELLANKFKDKQKISVFGLVSNTPKSSFGWNDVFKYGLENEMNNGNDEDENFSYSSVGQNTGIPQTIKTGFYFSDKLFKNTKLNVNYSYSNNQLKTGSVTKSQYYLEDTSYATNNTITGLQKNQGHVINLNLTQPLDSLTELQVRSSFNYGITNDAKTDYTDFNTSEGLLTRQTNINNTRHTDNHSLKNNLKVVRNFMKKDRVLTVIYNQEYAGQDGEGFLKTDNLFVNPTLPTSFINQRKTSDASYQVHNPSVTYMEPLGKKLKLEFSYDYIFNTNTQEKVTFNNVNGEYSVLDSTFTNDFKTLKQTNRAGLKLIFEVKKYRAIIGSRARNVSIHNENIFKQTTINQNVNNILPFASFRYKFTDNKSVNIAYYTSSSQPTVDQLQPVPDNTNPNFVRLGNPNLLPTFQHNFQLNFNNFKPISGKYTWAGFYGSVTDNAISSSTNYDNLGRTVAQSINVDGNMNFTGYIGTSWPFLGRKLNIGPNGSVTYNRNKTIINNQPNTTQTRNLDANLEVRYEVDKFSATVSGNYSYNSPTSSVNSLSNRPYGSQSFYGKVTGKLPKKFSVETEATYTINNQLNKGYNINYLVWNASLSKAFFKKENLILTVHAYDMLNQNINVNRNVQANVITDTKTNIISRYFLLQLTYKFTSNKAEGGNDEEF